MEFAQGARAPRSSLAGHVTKDGSIAGPKTLEHPVDAVVRASRVSACGAAAAARLRGTGSDLTEEVGVFEMRDAGLVRE